jgi:hypothetical protein
MATVAAEALQQKDFLCGPFQAARILRELGHAATEDELAAAAGSLLPERSAGTVPPGAVSKSDYAVELPRVGADVAGTAVAPLAAAVEAAAGGAVRAVPLSGEWTAQRIAALVERGTRLARLVANVRTGPFWGTRPPLELLEAELRGDEQDGPPSDWDVGHFCELVALMRGSGGSLVAVRDSYPSFGLGGYHLQPPRAVAAGLERGDGREGGVLAIAEADRAPDVERLAAELELEVAPWDNGTRR